MTCKTEKYAGPFGPADGMSALKPEFVRAYESAAEAIYGAVLEFERVTCRVVDSITLQRIDVTEMTDPGPRLIRQAALHFLPTPGEVGA